MAAYLSRIKEQSFAGKPLGRRDLTLAELRERRETLRIYGALVILLFVTIAPGSECSMEASGNGSLEGGSDESVNHDNTRRRHAKNGAKAMTIAPDERLGATDQKKLHALRIFLFVYGGLSLALFSMLLLGFIVQYQPLDEGQPLHWVIWDRVTDHVGPMLVVIYMVWSVFLIRAAADPFKYRSFL